MDVKDKVVLITGASGGIGQATARLLTERGARIILAARREVRLRQSESELPGSLAVVADVSRPADIEKLVQRSIVHFGRIDVLVNNAGQGLHVPIEDIKLDDYQAIMALNVYGPLLLMQAVVPHMRRQGGGVIVNVSSGTTKMMLPGVGAYASTKAALNMLSQTAREEFAAHGISVNLIYPYITETEFHRNLRASSPHDAATRRALPPGYSPEFVARYILHSIVSGETEIVLRPGMPAVPV